MKRYKVRVYLLRALNVSAVDSHIDIKSKLAGLGAFCSADAYPEIILGDGKNSQEGLNMVKYYSDRTKYIPNNLNPIFNRSYELDLTLPEDLKLEIKLWDYSYFQFGDTFIGSTVIDLENRYFGDGHQLELDALAIYEKQSKVKQKKLEKLKMRKPELEDKEKSRFRDIQGYITEIKNKESKIPVEYRELKHSSKAQPQGMLELWVEVLPLNIAAVRPMLRLEQNSKDEYEIRLIIWETADVPLVASGSVDIYVRTTFAQVGWVEDDVEKETDVHYGSKDGRGVFNYRHKFSMSVPCEFPRMKFQILDKALITSDQAIGEAILSLKGPLKKAVNEGKNDTKPMWLSCYHPNATNQERGRLKISFSLLPKVEADNNPVGEAQDQPNHSPTLIKPTEGRGIGDILIGKGLDFSKLGLPGFAKIRNLIIIAIVIVILVFVLLIVLQFKSF